MKLQLIEFARTLRACGAPIAASEIEDALRAVDLLTVIPGSEFFGKEQETDHAIKAAVKACLIKDKSLDKVFECFWNILFAEGHEYGEEATASHIKSLGEKVNNAPVESSPSKGVGDKDAGCGTGKGAGNSRPGQSLRAAVSEASGSKRLELAASLVNSASLEELYKYQLEETVHRLAVAVGWWEVLRAVQGMDQHSRETQELQIALEEFKDLLRMMTVERLWRELADPQQVFALAYADSLGNKNFALLNEVEYREIHKRVECLARRLAVKSLRMCRGNGGGAVHLRATMEETRKTGGIAIRLKRQSRKNKPRQLMVLGDVSGSVAASVPFILMLAFSLHNTFSRVRSFLFVDNLSEVTPYFSGNCKQEALQEAIKLAKPSISGFSDYGRVFTQLSAERDLSSRLILVIIGDGRNNWRPIEEDAFRQIAERVGKVFWLNTLSREKWFAEDSALIKYAPYCSGIFPCSCYRDIERFAHKLIKTTKGF